MVMFDVNPENLPPLTPAVFHVLLALAEGERHGYAIMRAVGGRPDPELDDDRRRYYRLTGLGQKLVRAEALRYEQLARLARRKRLLGRPAGAGNAKGF
jgi:DNA-binding PadR family transcriptional regulator